MKKGGFNFTKFKGNYVEVLKTISDKYEYSEQQKLIVTRFEKHLEQTGRRKIIASFSQQILPQIAESAVVSIQFLTFFDL